MLNNELYNALVAAFGAVKVAKVGEPLQYVLVDISGKEACRILDFGETYRVCCPLCARVNHQDTRFRLWISHAWGAQVRNMRLWNLVKCFHNDCYADPLARNSLIDAVFGTRRHKYNVKPSCGCSAPREVPKSPGACLPLSKLPANHHALAYLRDRGFDPAWLEYRYGVKYCVDSDRFPLAIDRIVIPVFHERKVQAWQCRYIGTPSSKSIPKYFTAPGTNIKKYLYDYDVASKCERMVIVEGVTDAWAVGDGAVALFGKTLSSSQLQLIASSQCESIVVFLDPDAEEESEHIVKQLHSIRPVYVVRSENDPASSGQKLCHELIREACARQSS